MRATLDPSRELMTLDLPTLDRPRNAISGSVGGGNRLTSVAAAMNRERTRMNQFASLEKNLQAPRKTGTDGSRNASRGSQAVGGASS